MAARTLAPFSHPITLQRITFGRDPMVHKKKGLPQGRPFPDLQS